MHLKPLVTPAQLLAHLVRDVDFRNERDPKFVVGAYGAKGAHLLYFRPGDNQQQARIIKPSAKFPAAKPGRSPWALTHTGDGVVHLIASGSDEVQAYRYYLDDDRLEEIPFTIPYDRDADTGSKFKHFYALRLCQSPFENILYGGGYPDCRLYAWDRTSRRFIDHGRVDEEENYLMWPCPLFENKIYCGLGSHAKLVEFDLQTREKRPLLPSGYLEKEFIVQLTRWRDKLAGIFIPNPKLFVFDPASNQVERVIGIPNEEDLYRTDQRNLVILGDEVYFGGLISDNLYRANLTTGRLEKIATDVGGPFGITENRYLWCHSAIDRITQFDLDTNRVVERFPCSYDGDGMGIFTMAFGPDGKTIYGGSFITQSFFKFDPIKNASHEFGQVLNLPGQVNSLQACKEKIFIGHYIHATVTEYDTTKPWQPVDSKNPNPRRLFSLLHEGQDRIWDMKLAGDGRIYLACNATYGKLSGALVQFDPNTYEYRVFHNLIPEQTLWCLEIKVPGKVIIGSWIYGGLGQKPTTTEGHLGIFDIATERIERLIVPVPNAKNVTSLVLWKEKSDTLQNGSIVGTADGSLFVYDLSKGEIIFRDKHGCGDTAHLCASHDGWVYGVAQRAIYRFDPSRQSFEKISDFQCDGFVDKIIEDGAGNLYISSMTELYRLER
jgi:outer membrane protein assembly factor BamB